MNISEENSLDSELEELEKIRNEILCQIEENEFKISGEIRDDIVGVELSIVDKFLLNEIDSLKKHLDIISAKIRTLRDNGAELPSWRKHFANAAELKSEMEECAIIQNTVNEIRIKSYQQYIKLSKIELIDKLIECKDIIVSYRNKSRNNIEAVKYKLPPHEYCPYCFNMLSNNPHLDHIYPVSLGGLSICENMVYVCSDCNIKKSNMTLRQFAVKYEMDFKKIESALEKLGKIF